MTGMFSQMHLLGNALRGSQQRHRVVSQNIANVNTPGYQTRRIDFDELVDQLKSNDAQKRILGDVNIHVTEGLKTRADGNNVALEREVGELKKNALAAQAYSHLLASKLATMRRAMNS